MERILEPEVMDSLEEAEEYDQMDFAQVNQSFAEDSIKLGPETGKILDLGTGTARIPLLIAPQRPLWQFTCIDLSKNMLKIAAENIQQAGLSDQIVLEYGDVKKLPYPDQSFDFVISNSLVHHLPKPEAFFQEIKRILKPDGGLLIRDLIRPDKLDLVNSLVHQYAGDATAHQQQLFRDSLQAALTLPEIEIMLKNANLENINLYQSSDRHWTAERQI